jgi:SAM-dependent methyltransferase
MSNFQTRAATYAEFRPDYPDELFRWASSLVPQHRLAWDCGTGSGQAASGLARYFDRIIATDIIVEQLQHARPVQNVEYRTAPAEGSGLNATSVDLIMVCQALHWFDRPQFFAEAGRVLVPEGALVVTVYGDAHVEGDAGLDSILQTFNKVTMRDYWPADRKLVDELYASVNFPITRLPTPEICLRKQWTLRHLAGYMRSWSATTRYVARHGGDPVGKVEAEMAGIWGDVDTTRPITWPFRIFAGRFTG